MNNAEFKDVVNHQMETCYSMLDVKNEEYTMDSDRLKYFKRAGILNYSTPKAALFGMLAKHLLSLADMCTSENTYHIERWSEKITDSINYLLLLRALVEEEKNE